MKLKPIAVALLAIAGSAVAQEQGQHQGKQPTSRSTAAASSSYHQNANDSMAGMDMSQHEHSDTGHSMESMSMPEHQPTADQNTQLTSSGAAAASSTHASGMDEGMHGMDMSQHEPGSTAHSMEGMSMPEPQQATKQQPMGNMDMTGQQNSAASHSMHGMEMGASMMNSMPGMFGPYKMSREASGTSWQPDNTPMEGIMSMSGPWMTMFHGYANTVYDHQSGPRGADQTFTESMVMAMASRPLGNGTLGLRAMGSLDPTIGKAGYPLLFETGETANGRTPLVDRQHPHDLLMELAASYSYNLSDDSSVFVYAGLPGEPALGPTAYMHRMSGMDNPEAPLTHHWLDSTHITFGVVTAGYVWRTFKLEASAFNGREPDQFRWNIETRKFDSASARLSWNPTPEWSFQVSHGRLDSPEQLEPNVAVRRTTASASYQHEIAGHPMQTTLAWGQNRHDPGVTSNGYLLESAMQVQKDTTVFGRFESVQNNELFQEGQPLHDQMFNVRKLSLGFVHDFFKIGYVKFGAGALVSRYSKPAALDPYYGASPSSYMLFFRAKLAM